MSSSIPSRSEPAASGQTRALMCWCQFPRSSATRGLLCVGLGLGASLVCLAELRRGVLGLCAIGFLGSLTGDVIEPGSSDGSAITKASRAAQLQRLSERATDPAMLAPETQGVGHGSSDCGPVAWPEPSFTRTGLTTRGHNPTERNRMSTATATATFAAGCFWGVEAKFRALPGVVRTTVGYAGGEAKDPTYKQVCRGRTGHAEAVEVQYDPSTISYQHLLATFWSIHNPTTRNRQGWDIGSQYRSVIFVGDDDQRAAALASREAHQGTLKRKIVTAIVSAERFWPAEDYHQQYLEKRGKASCAISVAAA